MSDAPTPPADPQKTQEFRVSVLLFAGIRERVGRAEVEICLPVGASVADLRHALAHEHPDVAELLRGARVAVDQAFAGETDPVPEDVEVAVIPPVSGGHDGPPPPERIAVLDRPLQLAEVVTAVEHAGAGGLATFTGNVRLHSRGKTVEYLDYEAYVPMAVKVMTTIADGIERDVEGSRVAIHHRIGRLTVGETAVVIAASAPHRAEAFEACRRAIEDLKKDVPIWKREVDVDGAEWIGQGP